ncbi:MAG: hypothetical protein US50_C0027G0008, partial [Candidatus Nomurabacteria bacterium GW2011_GWB1_37_5]
KSLQNLSQEIALEIKQAQTDAIVGKNSSLFDPDPPIYGVHFDISKNNQFLFFADTSQFPIGSYDEDINEEFFDGLDHTVKISRGNIKELCVYDGNNIEDCLVSNLDVAFKRPFPDAIISSNSSGVLNPISAKIRIEQREQTRTIEVSSLGQITVK